MLGVALCLVAMMVAGCRQTASDEGPVYSGTSAADPVKVEVARVARSSLSPALVVPAVVRAARSARLSPLSAGSIKELRTAVGEKVRRGDVLVVMDDARLVEAIAEFQPVKAQYERAQRLFADKAMSKARFEAVEAEFIALRRRIAHIEENTTIRAPFPGLVASITGRPGESFFPPCNGETGHGLLELVQLGTLEAVVAADQHFVPDFSRDMEAEVRADVYPETTWTGRVRWVAPAASPLDGRFAVCVQIENPGERLRHGYTVQVRFSWKERDGVLRVPSCALGTDSTVYVVRGERVRKLAIVPGRRWEGGVEVLAGLPDTATVVVRSSSTLADGMAVRRGLPAGF